ncbi:MAG: hypothetical protein FAF03_03470 [Epsilonproteobacteria bacterium]|nr:hypothetical protein [Campylobacterota bacterium]
MLKIKLLYIIIISIPLLILLVLGFYFSDKSWKRYQENKRVQYILNDTELLDKYEISVLHEILCTKLVGQRNTKILNICKERIETTKSLKKMLDHASDNIKPFISHIERLKEKSSKKKIEDFEAFLGQKEIHSSGYQFVKNINPEITATDIKNLLSTYIGLSDRHYATELENF